MLKTKHQSILPALLISALLLLQACSSEQQSIEGLTNEAAPDFNVELFDGGNFQLSEQKGKVVMINFFASWCVSCGEEVHHIQQAFEVYKKEQVAFLGVAVDDTEKKAKAFMKKNGLTIPAGLDRTGQIKELYGLYGMPTTFFIDKKGIVSYFHAGVVTKDLITHEIDKLL
jgi:peroxiredoxin